MRLHWTSQIPKQLGNIQGTLSQIFLMVKISGLARFYNSGKNLVFSKEASDLWQRPIAYCPVLPCQALAALFQGTAWWKAPSRTLQHRSFTPVHYSHLCENCTQLKSSINTVWSNAQICITSLSPNNQNTLILCYMLQTNLRCIMAETRVSDCMRDVS